MKPKYAYLVGIDEAGRGCIAGPVAVSALAFKVGSLRGKQDFLKYSKEFKLRDSKKTPALKREEWLKKLQGLEREKKFKISVSFTDNRVIDKYGIIYAINKALLSALKKLRLPSEKTLILLDGGLKAPALYKDQKTIIKGDEKEPIIALASIAAKVSRDRLMVSKSKIFPGFNFDVHKGYGTKSHYQKIREHGLSEIHRKSFLRRGKWAKK